ncbi:MAG TPA: ribonuclease domain-containing protein [Pseudonocardiaceae bacterium]|nr:ribonuclease domain-containing protein [Pseudonocardiaceae bacterium]
MSSGRRISIALAGLVLLAAIGWVIKGATTSGTPGSAPSVSQGSVPGSSSGLPMQALSALPGQAAQTYQLILKGGPFPYPHNDGVVYQNRERELPSEPSGYYHEYTVPTPGSSDRGTRRLITGKDHELYYTGDHYQTFVVVEPNR